MSEQNVQPAESKTLAQPDPPFSVPVGYAPLKPPKTNKYAILALVLGAILVLLLVAVAGYFVSTNADRDAESGEITEPGDVSAFSLEVGDCLNGLDETVLRTLPAVPCDEPHEGEVFAKFDLPEGDYPPDEQLFAHADQGCTDRLKAYAPAIVNEASIGVFYLYPQKPNWPQDREIVCIAAATSGTMTGSIKG